MEVVCEECGGVGPASEFVLLGDAWFCPTCGGPDGTAMRRIIEYLLEEGLIEKVGDDEYRLTERGIEEQLREAKDLPSC